MNVEGPITVEPNNQISLRPNGKPRKTKDQRGPRKRRQKKKRITCDSSTIDYGKIDRILQNFETNYFEDDDNYQNEDDIDDQNEKRERKRLKDWAVIACEGVG